MIKKPEVGEIWDYKPEYQKLGHKGQIVILKKEGSYYEVKGINGHVLSGNFFKDASGITSIYKINNSLNFYKELSKLK